MRKTSEENKDYARKINTTKTHFTKEDIKLLSNGL
jgi:hypothetical protein